MPLIPVHETTDQLARTLRHREPGDDDGPTAVPATRRVRTTSTTSTEEILTARRSVRAFAETDITLAQLRSVTDDAYATERRIWRHGRPGPALVVSAFRVTGLSTGVYTADDGSFAKLGDAPWPNGRAGGYADGAALLHICARAEQFPSGYAEQVVRAGALGYAAWLAAISNGLAASVYGRSCARITAIAQRENAYLRQVFTVAIGTAATPHTGRPA